MISYPFDSEITGYEADGSPVYDRAADSSVLRRWMMHYFTDGVFSEGGNTLGFNVLQGEGLTITTSAGSITIRGAIGIEDSIRTLETKAANPTYDRIDTVVARLNLETDVRNIDLYIIQGEPASSPVRPPLTRNLSIWELGLADIRIPKNSTQIAQANINDTRLDNSRCGVVASPFVTLDTQQIYLQIMSDITERKKAAAALYGVYQEDINTHEVNATAAYNSYVASMQTYQTAAKNDFDVWFQTIKDILDEEAAGNLQNQIDALKKQTSELATSKVDKLSGKGLSTNDFTDDHIARIEKVERQTAALKEQKPARTVALNLPLSAWTGSGPYTATISREDVTANTWVHLALDAASMSNYSADIDWSTDPGQIVLTTAVMPRGALAGSLVLMEVN